MSKFRHPVYLSEKEIADEFERNYFSLLDGLENEETLYREVNLGSGRADFISFGTEFHTIWEIKITATVDALRQVLFYKKLIELYQLDLFIRFGEIINPKLKYQCGIAARYFDKDLLDLCRDNSVSLCRLQFDENKCLKDCDYIDLNDFFAPATPLEVAKIIAKHNRKVMCEKQSGL